MTASDSLFAGLARLAVWANQSGGTDPIGKLFDAWATDSGFCKAGMWWPVESPNLAHGFGVGIDSPNELKQVAATLASGRETTLWQMPNSAGRLYTRLVSPGRAAGLLFAERAEPAWTDADRNYLVLSARLLERLMPVSPPASPPIDAARLAQRLDDAAILAGRAAHDFNNVLGTILGFADLMLPHLPPGSQAVKYLAEIETALKRGMSLTRQLHGLGVCATTSATPGEVGRAVAAAVMEHPAVSVWVSVPPTLPKVALAPESLALVVRHLVANACEATPPGGRVVVAAELVELSSADRCAYLGNAQPGPAVEVTITDAGPGIKPTVRPRVFAELFVTTKARHHGLGLATVYRTLAAHRGGVRVEAVSPPGTGTVARFVVPPAVVPAPAVPLLTTSQRNLE